MAYESTSVTVEKSQGDIRKMLVSKGAQSLGFGEGVNDLGVHYAAISFVFDRRAVRMRVPLKGVDQRTVTTRYQRARTRTRQQIEEELREQEARRIWRVIAWNLKARLVAVEEGVETFEEAFLAHLLDEATGRTIYEQLATDGRVELSAPLLQLTETTD